MELVPLYEAGRSMVGPIVVRDECQVMLPPTWSIDDVVAIYSEGSD